MRPNKSSKNINDKRRGKKKGRNKEQEMIQAIWNSPESREVGLQKA